MVDPRAVVLHKVGMSSEAKPEYFYNGIRNRLVFSKYLYGMRSGLVYGILVSLLSVRSTSLKVLTMRFQLWSKAVIDDMYGLPLSRQALQSVAKRFRGN
jgi:GT2 family glycosyltransferase